MENVLASVQNAEKNTSSQDYSKSLWRHAFESLLRDKIAVISFVVVAFYSILALLSYSGAIASDWDKEVKVSGDSSSTSYLPPSKENPFGTDIFGRSVFYKTIKGTEVAISVGVVVSLVSIFIGVFLGGLSGYFGGKVDDLIVWFYTTVSSIPYIMLLISITYILGKGLLAVYLALALTTWVDICRLVRAEVMRHKDREYLQAATVIGVGHFSKLVKHIFPNILHIIIINFSLQFQMAIKSEVILSYLGLGIQKGVSWGGMIDEAKLELARGVWWQLAAATFAMLGIVLALNLLGDSLRDALDPKLKGRSS